jgi:hypothetical protein
MAIVDAAESLAGPARAVEVPAIAPFATAEPHAVVNAAGSVCAVDFVDGTRAFVAHS